MPHTVTAVGPDGERKTQVPTESEREIIELVDSLHKEADDFRSSRQNGLSLEDQWEQNGHRFLGNHWTSSATGSYGLSEGYRVIHFTDGPQDRTSLTGLQRYALNRVQTSVVSNVAGQTQQQMVVRLRHQEAQDPVERWLSPEGGRILAGWQKQHAQQMEAVDQAAETGQAVEVQRDETLLSLRAEQLTGPEGPSEPLEEWQADYVQALIDREQLDPDTLVALDDRTITEAGQQVFDNRWELALGEQIATTNEFLCNIFGHQPIRVQWHAKGRLRDRFTLENTHIMNCWIDPTAQTIDEAEYLIFDYLLSADEAKAVFPRHREAIDEAATTGTRTDGNYRQGGVYRNTNFQRSMVTVRTAWMRHKPVGPMPPEEAVESGLVQPVLEPVQGQDGTETFATAGYRLPPDEEGAEGEQVQPGDENWPERTGLRQTVVLPDADALIEDIECPYYDIPFGWNINIPIPYSPYGQGEPQRLEDLQRQVNRLFSIFCNYIAYYQFPQRYWPQSVLDKLRKTGVQIHARPGAEVPIPDEEWRMMMGAGGVNLRDDPPTMPAILMQWMEMLLNEVDRMSGNVDIRQGEPPSSNMSGKALETLATQAYGPLAFKARYTEWAVERVASLAMDSMVKWMSDETWAEILDRYSRPVIRRIREKLMRGRWNFRVEVMTGRGTNQQQEEQRAFNQYQMGLISKRTAMERMRIQDPDEELRRIQEERLREATGSTSVQAAATDNAEAQQPKPQPAGQ